MRRNSLGEVNLNICMRLYESREHFTLQNFPCAAAFKIWKVECKKRGVSLTLDMECSQSTLYSYMALTMVYTVMPKP